MTSVGLTSVGGANERSEPWHLSLDLQQTPANAASDSFTARDVNGEM
jgi:hypothetical protein